MRWQLLTLFVLLSSVIYAQEGINIGFNSTDRGMIELKSIPRSDFCYLGLDNNFTGENTFYNLTYINYDIFNVTGTINATEYCITGVGCFSYIPLETETDPVWLSMRPDYINETKGDGRYLKLNQANWNNGSDRYVYWDSSTHEPLFNLTTLDEHLAGYTWYFVTNFTAAGTASGVLSNTWNVNEYDSITYNLSDSAGANLVWYANTSNNITADVNTVCIRFITSGATYSLSLYDSDGFWESYAILGSSNYTYPCFSIRDVSHHVIDGKILLKINSIGTPNPTHSIKIDALYVSSGYVPQTATNDGDPFAIHIDNSNPPIADIDWNNNDLTGVKYLNVTENASINGLFINECSVPGCNRHDISSEYNYPIYFIDNILMGNYFDLNSNMLKMLGNVGANFVYNDFIPQATWYTVDPVNASIGLYANNSIELYTHDKIEFGEWTRGYPNFQGTTNAWISKNGSAQFADVELNRSTIKTKLILKYLPGSYTDGKAVVGVYDNGTTFADDTLISITNTPEPNRICTVGSYSDHSTYVDVNVYANYTNGSAINYVLHLECDISTSLTGSTASTSTVSISSAGIGSLKTTPVATQARATFRSTTEGKISVRMSTASPGNFYLRCELGGYECDSGQIYIEGVPP